MSASFNPPSTLPRKQSPTGRSFTATDGGNLAYVRVARSEDVAFLCPEAPLLAPGQSVFVLYVADGTPVLVTDTHEAAIANAAQAQLEAVSLH